MLTYQDLLAIGESDNAKMDFVRSAIFKHQSTDLYRNAVIADKYDKKQNVTIMDYQKLLYTVTGEAVPDNFSANYKITSNFFFRFVTQESQYLLGNGVMLDEDELKDRLGKDFDTRLQEVGRDALVDGVAFGFWNKDHMEVFRITELVPLYDEENGALMAAIRFWQIDQSKPLRATLYEPDGYTEYIWRKKDDGEILKPKRQYIIKTRSTPLEGTEIYDYENYPTFPIVPLWGNTAHQSELVGIREAIDAYDLIKSGFCNTVDEASLVYWTIQNAGGMDDIDLAKFVERIRTLHAATVEDDGAKAESHSLDVPYQSREALLTRLRSDLYDDFMALDTKEIAGGATTATQIKAAYEPINSKADMFEYCVHDFLDGIFLLAGIESDATFTRSLIVNSQEEITTVISAASYLSDEYVTQKILMLLGDGDKLDEVLKEMDKNETDRFVDEVENEETSEQKESELGEAGTEGLRIDDEANRG